MEVAELVDDDDYEMVKQEQEQMIIAMKGHPGSGKSTLARAIASSLRCPLIDKDDVRDCTPEAAAAALFADHLHHHHQQREEEEEAAIIMTQLNHMMNELSYEVIWRIAKTQLDLGLNIVIIDSPLSRRSHLDRLLQLINATPSSSSSSKPIRLVIIECRPQDETEWRRRLEYRGRTISGAAVDDEDLDGGKRSKLASSSHKPSTWLDLQRLMERYNGCWDYDVGDVPKLVLDTTAPNNTGIDGVGNLVSSVLNFLSSLSSSSS